MPTIKLFGPPDPQQSNVIGTADIINMLPTVGLDGRLAWTQRPGLTAVSLANWPAGNLRAWMVANDKLYAVVGSDFISVDTDLKVTVNNGPFDTSSGPCYIAWNLFKICVTDGKNAALFDPEDLSAVDVSNFPGGRGMTFLNGFLLSGGNDPDNYDTIKCYASKVYEADIWDALSFGAVESKPDPLLLVESTKDAAIMYGSDSTEVWNYNGDGTAFPFSYLPGSAITYGLAAVESVATLGGSKVALMKSGNSVMPGYIEGYNLISLTKDYPAISLEWSRYSRVDDAVGCSYTLGGKPVYQITFPTVGKTWVYDATSGTWVRFETGGSGFIGVRAIDFNGTTYVATRDGAIYKFDPTKSSDGSTPAYFELRSNPMRGLSTYSSVSRITLDLDTGNAPSLPESTEYDPTINISISGDGGYTFKPSRTIRTGKIGEFKTRATVRRLGGKIKDLVVKVSGTSEIIRNTIMSQAEAEIENEQNTVSQ